jgi:hypothetical protein
LPLPLPPLSETFVLLQLSPTKHTQKKKSRREIQKQEEQLYRLGIDNGKTCQPKLMVFMHLINENTKSKELIVCSFCSQHFRGPFQNIIWSHSKGNE